MATVKTERNFAFYTSVQTRRREYDAFAEHAYGCHIIAQTPVTSQQQFTAR